MKELKARVPLSAITYRFKCSHQKQRWYLIEVQVTSLQGCPLCPCPYQDYSYIISLPLISREFNSQNRNLYEDVIVLNFPATVHNKESYFRRNYFL